MTGAQPELDVKQFSDVSSNVAYVRGIWRHVSTQLRCNFDTERMVPLEDALRDKRFKGISRICLAQP